jgi:hypothetical protein
MIFASALFHLSQLRGGRKRGLGRRKSARDGRQFRWALPLCHVADRKVNFILDWGGGLLEPFNIQLCEGCLRCSLMECFPVPCSHRSTAITVTVFQRIWSTDKMWRIQGHRQMRAHFSLHTHGSVTPWDCTAMFSVLWGCRHPVYRLLTDISSHNTTKHCLCAKWRPHSRQTGREVAEVTTVLQQRPSSIATDVMHIITSRNDGGRLKGRGYSRYK